jgi:hypothetical protein
MTCQAALHLLASASDGYVPPSWLEPLIDHVGTCAACWSEAETQMMVKQILASRPEEPLPAGLARRIAKRLDREALVARRSMIDWRRLTLHLVAVAAGLAATAVVVHHAEPRRTVDLARAIVAFGQEEVRTAHFLPLARDATDEQTLGFLLLAPSSDQLKESR